MMVQGKRYGLVWRVPRGRCVDRQQTGVPEDKYEQEYPLGKRWWAQGGEGAGGSAV